MLAFAFALTGCVEAPTKQITFNDDLGNNIGVASIYDGLTNAQSERFRKTLMLASGGVPKVLYIEQPSKIVTEDGQALWFCGRVEVNNGNFAFFYTEGSPNGMPQTTSALIVNKPKVSCDTLMGLQSSDPSIIGRYGL